MLRATGTEELIVCTVGHSTHPIDEFVGMMESNDIRSVLDVRTVPRSRHNPQFNLDALPGFLEAVGIAYTHLPELGGLRRTRADSPNAAWRNVSFRGYADYMQTTEFEQGVERVMQLASQERCVLMCAEAVPWRCHRSLIADALTVRGARVEDIIGAKGRRLHVLTPWARVDGFKITYPIGTGNEASQERDGAES
ncbi:MAG: hypothetical protein JWR21_3829 [Herminiimonas sp.]|nr:hypothetical protein [Herminiimonas sp.]